MRTNGAAPGPTPPLRCPGASPEPLLWGIAGVVVDRGMGEGGALGYTLRMQLTIEFDREADGRWIAEVTEIPGALAYGSSRDEAAANAQAIALRAIADRLEDEGSGGESFTVAFVAA